MSIFLSQEGKKAYEQELQYLCTVRRPEIAQALAEARSHGDLSENAEYDEAKNEQAKLEARISEIENILKNCKISTVTNDGKVHIGSTVRIFDYSYNEETTYLITSTNEADPFNGKLSDESPIGNALLNHKANDTVTAQTPECIISLKILSVN